MKLEAEILQWAADRQIIGATGKATSLSQFVKTVEEVAELGDAITKNNPAMIQDAIGDIIVTLVLQAQFHGLVIDQCVQAAYDQIKCRQGRMVGGVFVKEQA